MAKTMMKVLPKDEIELIHNSSLKILSEVGVKINSPYVVDLPQKAKTGTKAGGSASMRS